MSDNPLADWLRERGAWSGDQGEAEGPSTALGPAVDPGAAGPARPAPLPPGVQGHPTAAAGDHAHVPVEPFPGDWPDSAPRPERPRRLWLLGLAAVPWLGFAAIALATLGGADASGGSDGAADEQAASGGSAGAEDEQAASPAPDETASAPDERPDLPSGGARAGAGGPGPAPPVPPARADDASGLTNAERRAGAAAALAVRTEITGEVAAEDGPVRYVDLAVAESVDWIEDVAIVEVAAVVLESVGDEWGEARPTRFAVPVRVGDAGAVALAAPWPLGSPVTGEAPAWEPVADTDLAAAAASALTEGGYAEVTDVSLARSGDVPDVLAADVVAVGPGDTEATDHHVWLRDGDPPSLLAFDR